MYKILINIHFKFYIQSDCFIKIQNNVYGKGQDYNATIARQENINKKKFGRRKSLTKRISLPQIHTPNQNTVHTEYKLL